MERPELGTAELWTSTVRFLGGGAFSGSSPFASRFLRLSRLFRFDLAPSACTDALLGGAGDDLGFESAVALFNEAFPGGGAGELT